MKPLGLSTYRWNNNIKSMLLVAAFPVLLLGLVTGFFWVVALFSQTPQGFVDPLLVSDFIGQQAANLTPSAFVDALTRSVAPFVFGVAGAWVLIGSLFNEGLIRMATHAKPVLRAEHPDLYNLLENLCISRGIAMPKLFMIDTPILNAYASGLTEKSFAVTVTHGLVERLEKNELEAVLAHELSHITNRDVRLLIVTVLFGGMLSFFAEMAWRSMRFGGGSRRGKGSGAVLLIAALVLSVGYLISMLFRFALSRNREYLADAGAVDLTKDPASLISALEKISGNAAMPEVPSGVQAMLIENPPGFFGAFATHPPIAARIAVLRRLGGIPDEGESIIPSTKS